jgi:hypothetical protein
MKRKLLIPIMLLGLFHSVFSEDQPVVFDTSGAFSWYPYFAMGLNNNYGSENIDYQNFFNYNIRLNMGLKLFNKVNAYFDLGVDDSIMEGMMNLAGGIGSKYFGVQIDYHKLNFPIFWYDSNEQQKLRDDFSQTWTTVALIGPRLQSKPGNIIELLFGADLLLGFFWTHAVTPGNVIFEVGYEYGSRIVHSIFDRDYVSDTWGLRIWATRDLLTENHNQSIANRLFNSLTSRLGLSDIVLCCDSMVDIGLGIGKPSAAATARADELQLEYQDENGFNILYTRFRVMIGVGKEWKIGGRNILNLELGIDINSEGFYGLREDGYTDFQIDNFGPYLSVGARF